MASWTPSAPASVPAPPQAEHRDIHTFSDVSAFRIEHVHLDWLVDWKARIISGTVTHDVVIIKDGVDSLTLDTSYLDIQRTFVDGQEADTKLGARKGTLGSPLIIPLESKKNKDDKVKIEITYSTTKDCTALGWLEKEQTAGKTSPFLYSQCQAIHCRSMVPITDSPSHKILYTAKVRSSVPVLMSALFDTSAPSEKDVYYFKQQVSIPNYLLAIVGGDLEFRKLGPRTGVWAEKPMADAVQWEFERDAEHFLAAAEKTISPYSWTRYDSVVLPPSFPYGGMENANLTTLTPTLITGDRSLVDVLLHELVHSWSGNLTSCANWESFWLNEGWTVYWERLLLQVLHSPAERGFSYLLGAKDLKDALKQFDKVPRFQRLIPVFKDGEDPDDAFSSIPYEKGSNFLLHIEETIGGLDVFLPYARSYFHAFFDRSVSTDEWKQHLYDFFASQPDVIAKLNTIKWDAWLHGEGSELPVEMTYNMTLAKEAFGLAARWDDVITGKIDVKKANFGPHDVKHLDANQMVAFLEKLHSGPPVPPKLVKLLDEAYSLSTAGNCEIRLRFYEVALEVEAGVYAKQAAEWVQGVGRMKFARTTFRALYNVDKDLARKTFIANRSFYHPIAAGMIQKDLEL